MVVVMMVVVVVMMMMVVMVMVVVMVTFAMVGPCSMSSHSSLVIMPSPSPSTYGGECVGTSVRLSV